MSERNEFIARMKKIKPKWVNAADLAEFAEALRINTDQVISAIRPAAGSRWVVLFSPEPESEDVKSAIFFRDEAGILRQHGRTDDVPGFWDGLYKGIGEKLEETFGPPKGKAT